MIASSSDHTTEEHIRLAQLTVDRAKRIAETGGQVLILLDSLTRLARAYNKGSNSGRTMSGGIDIRPWTSPSGSSAPPGPSTKGARSPSWPPP